MHPHTRRPPLLRPRVIAVDIDGTLVHGAALNEDLVAYLRERKSEGYRLMLWSMRGHGYADSVAKHFGLGPLFDDVLAKPGYVVDNEGWDWIKSTVVVWRTARKA